MSLAHVPNQSDPEQLGAAHVAARVERIPTGRSQFHARVISLRMDRVWTLRVFSSTPRTKWTAQSPQRAFIRFRTIPETGLINDGGRTTINAGAPPVNKPGKEELTARSDEPEWLSTLPAGVHLVYDYREAQPETQGLRFLGSDHQLSCRNARRCRPVLRLAEEHPGNMKLGCHAIVGGHHEYDERVEKAGC